MVWYCLVCANFGGATKQDWMDGIRPDRSWRSTSLMHADLPSSPLHFPPLSLFPSSERERHRERKKINRKRNGKLGLFFYNPVARSSFPPYWTCNLLPTRGSPFLVKLALRHFFSLVSPPVADYLLAAGNRRIAVSRKHEGEGGETIQQGRQHNTSPGANSRHASVYYSELRTISSVIMGVFSSSPASATTSLFDFALTVAA
ncbi:hypothetical protein F5X99DRAFT_32126 [Biscogniauxia marginata]|nr:hypothetical protein F5X99DRAFT_32126 [Biscogniauxia marginata]